MKYSASGLHLTESFEGCKLRAYQDTRGVWTIGYGHTRDVYAGMTCTTPQAEAWLMEDVQWAAGEVNRLVHVPLAQSEFDALTDFTFNIGCGNFEHSMLLRVLNARNYQLAAAEFDRWDKGGGKVVAGLLRRRKAEEAEFQSA